MYSHVHALFHIARLESMSKELEGEGTVRTPYDDEDAGLFFVLWPSSRVHDAMGLASVPNIRPRLQQGKKSY